MGSSQSKISPIHCPASDHVPKKNEFELSLDSRAFELHILKTPNGPIGITRLNWNGEWNYETILCTKESPFNDGFIKIAPGKNQANMEVFKEPVTFLYQSSLSKPESILCYNNREAVLYISLFLSKQRLQRGSYKMNDDSFVLTPNSIYIINLPKDNQIRPNISDVLEKSFDPLTAFISQRPI